MNRDPLDRFMEAWKERAQRPAETPAPIAARRLLERLPPRRSRWPVRLLATAATALLALLGSQLWVDWQPFRDFQPPPASVPGFETPPLDSDVALIWLDPETPLYLTLEPPNAKKVPKS